ncbi:hypothetical protein [Leuconostoc pseudomesenteroides]|uniref:hypothetical protein n=1 Tax=Leuconostoc pseudomesenteroides TaxID=33968 RepID=UPI004034FB54
MTKFNKNLITFSSGLVIALIVVILISQLTLQNLLLITIALSVSLAINNKLDHY